MARVIFVQDIYYPYQSTARLAAYLKSHGHQALMAIGDDKKVISEIRAAEPDLIAFSVLTPHRNHLLTASRAIKAAGIDTPIIAGGYDITFTPEILENSDVDIICRGEGEEPLKELCNALDGGADYTTIPNLSVKEGETIHQNPMRAWVMDLDELPFDDRDIYLDYDPYFKIVPFTQIIAGRGCPYPCTYCFSDSYRLIYKEEGSPRKYCNLRSPENVIAELRILKEKYAARYIFFNDSTLTYNKRWLLEFLPLYAAEIGIPFSINAVISEITDEVGRALYDTGCCALVRIGLETGNEELRRTVLGKNLSNDQFIDGIEVLQKYEINYSTLMMLGLPGETLQQTWESIDFAGRLLGRKSVQSISLFIPFPGLPITDYGIKIGCYKEEQFDPTAAGSSIFEGDANGPDVGNISDRAKELFFYYGHRTDDEFEQILRLSRFSYLAVRYRWVRPLIRRLMAIPDNLLFRLLYTVTDIWYSVRIHAQAPISFYFRYIFFHLGKKTV